jgi:hypothetical protein
MARRKSQSKQQYARRAIAGGADEPKNRVIRAI